MVLSNKKLKEKLRAAKAELLVAREISEDPDSKSGKLLNTVLESITQKLKSSKREQRNKRAHSSLENSSINAGVGEESGSGGEKGEKEGGDGSEKRNTKKRKNGANGVLEKVDLVVPQQVSVEEPPKPAPLSAAKALKRLKRELRPGRAKWLEARSAINAEVGRESGIGDEKGGKEGDNESDQMNMKKWKISDMDGLESGQEVKKRVVMTPKKKKKKKKKQKKKSKGKKETGNEELKEGVKVVEEVAAQAITDIKLKEVVDAPTKVYVGGIPYYSNEDDIRSFFEGCGTITKIDCMIFPDTGKFRGIAIINFKTEAAAKRALGLDGSDMGGLFLKVQAYNAFRSKNKVSNFSPAAVDGYNRIYIGNLSWDITEDDLRNFFSGCQIASIRFGEDKETGVFKGYAHVDFADNPSLQTALKLDQKIVCGRPVRISCAVPKKLGALTKSRTTEVNNAQVKSLEDVNILSQDNTAVPSQENNNTDFLPSNQVENVETGPLNAKIRRRTCYECGERGHESSSCPMKQAVEQGNRVGVTTSISSEMNSQVPVTKSRSTEMSTQLKSFDDSNFTRLNNVQVSNQLDALPSAPVEIGQLSAKIRRRTCYECGERGHLSSFCVKKKGATEQGNQVAS
ncbi:unnamed protein product [Cuscuta epithymum]|uniref:Uncharacterized protein n=2 Tax=Cuscuta epithymum TaxID=186058 RepID=A0AAV0ETQ6_9ASTE|nr:unnamed protein product [Cuscuta epithymum]